MLNMIRNSYALFQILKWSETNKQLIDSRLPTVSLDDLMCAAASDTDLCCLSPFLDLANRFTRIFRGFGGLLDFFSILFFIETLKIFRNTFL